MTRISFRFKNPNLEVSMQYFSYQLANSFFRDSEIHNSEKIISTKKLRNIGVVQKSFSENR